MPFRQYTQFNAGVLHTISTAYDSVIARLGIPPSDPRTSQIATKIVTLVSDGEYDVAILCNKTCQHLSK